MKKLFLLLILFVSQLQIYAQIKQFEHQGFAQGGKFGEKFELLLSLQTQVGYIEYFDNFES